jgi:hypothetical protein
MTHQRMTDDQVARLAEFLQALDAICLIGRAGGLSTAMIAGSLVARAQTQYLSDDQADLDGLTLLLQTSIDRLNDRPRWEI